MMQEFFRGWKRKAGCGLLLVTLIFFVAWLRSYHVRDSFAFGSGQQDVIDLAESSSGQISWRRHHFDREIPYPAGWNSRLNEKDQGAHPTNVFLGSAYTIESRWNVAGFDFGVATNGSPMHDFYAIDDDREQEDPKDRVTFWIIPYWSVVLPITLLSANLILRKPRQRLKPNSLPNPELV